MGLSLFNVLIFFTCLKIFSAVKVSVYYETLCPDSVRFIVDQLHPNYDKFGDKLIELELVPYGNAKTSIVDGQYTFTCQHGPEECYGNKVHGCVFNNNNIPISESFVYCSEDSYLPAAISTFEKCANQTNIRWSSINDCLTSDEANSIMFKNDKKTNKIGIQWVPTIIFDDVYNETVSRQAENDFESAFCQYLDNKPDQCTSNNEINLQIIVL